MNKQNKIYIFIFCSVIFTAIIVGLTFAYINKADVANNVTIEGNVDTTVPHTWTFGDEDTEVTLSIMLADMESEDVGSYVETTFSNFLQLNSTKNSSLVCSYDITYKANSKYTQTDNNDHEFTISGTSSKGDTLSEISIPEVGAGSSSALGNFTITPSDNKVTWNFSVKFYNIDKNQENVYNSNPGGYVYFVESHCGE